MPLAFAALGIEEGIWGRLLTIGGVGGNTAPVEVGKSPDCSALPGGKPAAVVIVEAAVTVVAGVEVTSLAVVIELVSIVARQKAIASLEAPRLISCFSVKIPARKRRRGSRKLEQFRH